jgi:hypothetical protein
VRLKYEVRSGEEAAGDRRFTSNLLKAYRVDDLAQFAITEPGYAMPLELWVEAAAARLRIRELAVPPIYLEEKRSFGGELDHAETRLRHYHGVINRSMRHRAQFDINRPARMQPQQS